ncbi:MAG: DUF2341 domain-containing protein [Pseudomonadales bacterium]|nr:DUF2341 domain-containing protein [Pseudomonadales bacterium]
MKRSLFKIVVIMLALAPTIASAWWNDKWPYRMAIAVDTSQGGAAIQSNLADVPVLIRLHSGNFQDFFLVKEDLSDLRFVAMDDKTPLKYHVEHFDLVNQMMFVWLKMPSMTGNINTEKVWMYYGNAEAVASEDAAGSFDVHEALAFHFDASNTTVVDQTAYANQVVDNSATLNGASLIASGAMFDGNQQIRIQDNPSLRIMPDTGFTFSAWVKPQGTQLDNYLFHRKSGAAELIVAIDGNTLYSKFIDGGSVFETPRSILLAQDTWQHITVVMKATEMSVYLNANPVMTVPVSLIEMGGATTLGSDDNGGHGFVGEMDEVRFSKIARDADWIKAAVANQGQPDKLLAVQPGEQLGDAGGSNGFFAVIFTSTGETGWTIIALLALMGFISWMVMIGKALYIRHVKRDNEAFLAQYRELGNEDPAMLDHEETEEEKELSASPVAQAIFGKHDHFQSSPIYHLYHRTIQEVHARLGKSAGAKASALSPQAVEAIKAALDADMTREMQKLNGQMVLLTIAISGGPFLGLLGTVVGVMITFAAIAATGDVNIAAIAPGVAAALLTTVAGLFVAIPALFGYNWLMSRIKETVVDMRVFADEFLTRIAEYYGE